jgi:hypothetical protein
MRMASWRPVGAGDRDAGPGRVAARLAGVVAAAQALVLLAAGSALAQAATSSSTLHQPAPTGRRVNLVFVIVAVAGAVLILLLQRRASRRLDEMFPTDPDDSDGRPGA